MVIKNVVVCAKMTAFLSQRLPKKNQPYTSDISTSHQWLVPISDLWRQVIDARFGLEYMRMNSQPHGKRPLQRTPTKRPCQCRPAQTCLINKCNSDRTASFTNTAFPDLLQYACKSHIAMNQKKTLCTFRHYCFRASDMVLDALPAHRSAAQRQAVPVCNVFRANYVEHAKTNRMARNMCSKKIVGAKGNHAPNERIRSSFALTRHRNYP